MLGTMFLHEGGGSFTSDHWALVPKGGGQHLYLTFRQQWSQGILNPTHSISASLSWNLFTNDLEYFQRWLRNYSEEKKRLFQRCKQIFSSIDESPKERWISSEMINCSEMGSPANIQNIEILVGGQLVHFSTDLKWKRSKSKMELLCKVPGVLFWPQWW